MMSKMASLLALSMLVLGATSALAQEATSARRMPYPFPAAGTFTGKVLTRGFYPGPIPMAANANDAQPQIAPAPGGTSIWNPNRGVSGAQVTITSRLPIYYKGGAGIMPPMRTWNTSTGWDGSFSFSGLPNGSYTYKVSHGEFATASGSFAMRGRIGTTQDIYLKRQANQVGSFAGRVTVAPRWPIFYAKPMAASSVDAGLAGAEAQAAADEAPLDAEEAAADKLTEPEAGATPPDAAAAAPTAAGAASPQGLTIARPIYLGRPLANAQVSITGQPYIMPFGPGEVRPAIGILPQPSRTWNATTDSNGSFGVKGLPAGRYTYRVTHKYFQPRGGSFTVGSFETDVYRTIQLERRIRGTFAGVVGETPQYIHFDNVRPTGGADQANRMMPPPFKPLPGARIVAVRSRFMPFRPLPGPIVYARDLQPTAANAAAPAPDAAPPADAQAIAQEDAELLKASESDGADNPAPEDDKVDAAVADAEGNASAAATDATAPQAAGLTASGAAAPAIARCIPIQWPTPYYRRAVSDQNGRFSIAKLPAGTYRFVVREGNHQPQLGWFTVSGTSPRVYRRILLQGRGGDLPPVIDPDGFNGQVLGYQMPLDVVYANGTANQGIRAPDQRMIPIAGASVSMQVIAPPGMMVPQVLAQTSTDANGYFQFRNAAGRAVIYVEAKGYHPHKQEISRASSGWTTLKIYLRPVFTGLPPVVGKPLEAVPTTGTSVEDAFGK